MSSRRPIGAQLTKAIEALQLGEGTAIGDAIAAGVQLLQRGQTEATTHPARWSCCPTARRLAGGRLPTARRSPPTPRCPSTRSRSAPTDGTITNPHTGETDPVPVKLDELQSAADATGGKAYVAPSADDLAKAYADIRANLQQTRRRSRHHHPRAHLAVRAWRQSCC